jgi:rod shape-determining protein MreD
VAAVAYLAARAPGFASVGWAILLGLLRDGLSLDPLGTHAFVLGTVAWLFGEGRGHRGRVEGAMRLGLTFGAALAAAWILALRLLPLGRTDPAPATFLLAVPSALWTVAAAALLYPVLDRMEVLDDLWGRRRGLAA